MARSNSGVALGYLASADGTHAVALGRQARVTGTGGVAVGRLARANERGSAFGYAAIATGVNATAFGSDGNSDPDVTGAAATGANSSAFGVDSVASADGATAFGVGAVASHSGSSAIGAGAVTTADNQVMLGAGGTSIALGDITASDAAQQGAEHVVTVDASGTLGISNVASTAAIQSVRANMDHIAAVSDAQFDLLTGRVDSLQGQLANFDLRMEGLEGGIASAMAMGGAMPVPGKAITLTVSGASYGGEQSFAGSLVGRVNDSIYVSAGVSGNTGDDRVGGRVSASFGF